MSNVDYVVHAAALKQVPSAEYNPIEFVKTKYKLKKIPHRKTK